MPRIRYIERRLLATILGRFVPALVTPWNCWEKRMKPRKVRPEPLIHEIRDIRHRISERYGHDPRRRVEYYLEQQQVDAPPEAKAVQESQESADRDHARWNASRIAYP